jgi:hypothetical protein
MMGSVET